MMSLIQNILDNTVTEHEHGLDYAAYAVIIDPAEHSLEILGRALHPQLGKLLKNFACEGRTADQQKERWEELLRQVHKALAGLDDDFVGAGQGENVRVVFDLDMGGVYYTRLGRHAVLFGATLDQEEVNNGQCERDMYRMVAQIEAVSTTQGS
ncbi:MAG: hypothetical protein ABSF64_01330 [Bryobacteraceae bacterium]|jgi:hypothetical protein